MKRELAILIVFLFCIPHSWGQSNQTRLKTKEKGIEIHDSITATYVSPGIAAYDINAVDTNGKYIHLYLVQSKITILYFYDFECRFCDRATDELLKIYHVFKKKGVEVFAVPLSSDSKIWKSYIRRYGLDWINALPGSEDTGNIRDHFKLNATPTIYLLDEQKIIFSKRLVFGDDVEKALLEKFSTR